MDKIAFDTNEQERIAWVSQKLGLISAGSRILDAGAGEQQYKKFCKHLNYVSQDFAKYEPQDLKLGLQMSEWNYGQLDIISDITSIPESDQSFDAIMCTEVFEHIPDPIAAIKEFSRLLKKEGVLILTAPFCSMTHFAPFHYYSGFNRFFYEEHLVKNGFKIIEIKANGNYFDYLKQEVSRVEFIAQQYNSTRPNFFEKKAMGILYKMLSKFSKQSKGSEELLNFGFHIYAQKI